MLNGNHLEPYVPDTSHEVPRSLLDVHRGEPVSKALTRLSQPSQIASHKPTDKE